MEELRFNSSGTHAVFLANINTFFAALFALSIFQNGWRDDKLGDRSVLQQCLDWFRQTYEGGQTGNRLLIAARNSARKDLSGRIQMILHYVAMFADESDINSLLSSGVVTKKSRTRARRSVKSVSAN